MSKILLEWKEWVENNMYYDFSAPNPEEVLGLVGLVKPAGPMGSVLIFKILNPAQPFGSVRGV